jgi:hypothetical protein
LAKLWSKGAGSVTLVSDDEPVSWIVVKHMLAGNSRSASHLGTECTSMAMSALVENVENAYLRMVCRKTWIHMRNKASSESASVYIHTYIHTYIMYKGNMERNSLEANLNTHIPNSEY